MKNRLLLFFLAATPMLWVQGQSELHLDSPIQGEITNITNVSNFFEVNLEAQTAYQIEMTGDLDAYLELYDGNQEIASNDDGGDGLNARLVFEPTRSGTFIVNATRTSGLDGESLGKWELTLSKLPCIALNKSASAELWIREDNSFNVTNNNVCVKFPQNGNGRLVLRPSVPGSDVTLWMQSLSAQISEPLAFPLHKEMNELSVAFDFQGESWLLYLTDSETWYREGAFPVWEVSGQ